MSAAKRSDRPAFPIVWPLRDGADTQYVDEGMTLRDYFAAKAMQALLSDFEKAPDERDVCSHYAARRAYQVADAMLAERAK